MPMDTSAPRGNGATGAESAGTAGTAGTGPVEPARSDRTETDTASSGDHPGRERLDVAVLIAAHNRLDLTVAAVSRLFELASARATAHWQVRVVLTDDGSTDGTSQAVAALGLRVSIVEGHGDWFWARSMAEAWRAVQGTPDLIVWLNDDVLLADDALVRLDEWHARQPEAVLVGQLRDIVTGEWAFGGRERVGRSVVRHRPAIATDTPIDVEMIHGNVVVIPRVVAERVGPIDGGFSHGTADFDYGLRVAAAGFRNLVLPGYLGEIATNPTVRARSMRESLRFYEHRLGFPYGDRKRLLRRHGGRSWPLQLAMPYVAVLLGYRPETRLPYAHSSSATETDRGPDPAGSVQV